MKYQKDQSTWLINPNFTRILMHQIIKTDMKKFTIKETRPSTSIWYYEVEAENENEALEKVFERLEDPIDIDVELDYDVDGEFEIVD